MSEHYGDERDAAFEDAGMRRPTSRVITQLQQDSWEVRLAQPSDPPNAEYLYSAGDTIGSVRPPVAVVTMQGRIVAIFPRSPAAVAYVRRLPWGREMNLRDPVDAIQQLVLEQAEDAGRRSS